MSDLEVILLLCIAFLFVQVLAGISRINEHERRIAALERKADLT